MAAPGGSPKTHLPGSADDGGIEETASSPTPHATTPWRWITATGVVGLVLGVSFPFARVDSLATWWTRLTHSLERGWVDKQTPFTALAFAAVAAAAVYAFPRVKPAVWLLAGSAFGVANEAWQAGFLVRHPQLGDAAVSVLGVAVGVGVARRLPRLADRGRPVAGLLAVVLSLIFASVLALSVNNSVSRTERFGTGPRKGFVERQAEKAGTLIWAQQWKVSVPFHTPERAMLRPDGRRGLPMGASMTLVAGLAAAGLGRTASGRRRWALAAAVPPFAVAAGSLFLFDTPWQGTPTGLTLGVILVAGVVSLPPLRAAPASSG